MVQLGEQVELGQKFSILPLGDLVLEHFYGTFLFGTLTDCPIDLPETALTYGLLEVILVCRTAMDDANETGNVYLQLTEHSGSVNVP